MKKILKIGIIVLILAAAAGGIWYFKLQTKPASQKSQKQALTNVQRNLTQDQEKIYKDRIEKAKVFMAGLKPEQQNYASELSNAYIYLGQQYYGLGELELSKEMYEQAAQSDSKNEQALVALALTLSEGKDLYGAQVALDKALEIKPQDADIWLRSIQLRVQTGSSAGDIEQLYKQALEATGRKIDVITSYARFEEEQGKGDAAVALWQEAVQKNPISASVYEAEIARLKTGR